MTEALDDDADDLPCCQLLDVSSSRASHDEAAQGGRDTVKSTCFWGLIDNNREGASDTGVPQGYLRTPSNCILVWDFAA